jgi:proline dehydrogenase
MNIFDKLAAASIPLVPRFIVRRLSTRYIAGEKMEKALVTGKNLLDAGYQVTYDILGEAVEQEAGVRSAAAEYIDLIEALVSQGLELNISLKPTQMGLNLSEDFCFDVVSGIASVARDHGAFIRFEMEDSPTTEATLQVFHRLREEFGGTIGCVLQSMLFRSVDDARHLVSIGQPLNVRLVKGIYVEPKEVAWQGFSEVNASYLETLRVLLEGGAFVGLATHDEKLIQGALKLLEEMPEAKDRVEIQMLLGVQETLRKELKESGIPMRIYIPFGTQWYPYVTRRLKKNPRLARYAMKGLFMKKEKLAP